MRPYKFYFPKKLALIPNIRGIKKAHLLYCLFTTTVSEPLRVRFSIIRSIPLYKHFKFFF